MSATQQRDSTATTPATGMGMRFALLWTASAATCVGDGVLMTAGPLLVLSLTSDPRIVAAAQFAVTLPYLLFGIVGGVAVDRLDRRRLMATLDFARGVLLGVVVLALAVGLAPIPILLISLFVLAAADTVFRTAAQAVLPSIVREENLVAANGRLMSAETIGAQFIGPALGGLLFAWAIVLPFVVDGVSFALSGLLVLLALPIRRLLATPDADGPQTASSTGMRGVLKDSMKGVSWLWQQAPMRFLATASALINFFTAATNAIMVIYVRHILHLGGFGFGVVDSCAAAGGVLAGLVSGRIAGRLGVRNTLAFAAALQAAGQLILLVAHDRVLTVLALSAASYATVQFSSVSVALRQRLIPNELLGRVMSVYRMLAWGSLPVGALAAGVAVHQFGLRSVFGLGTVVMTGLVVAVLLRAKAYNLAGRPERAPAPAG